MPDYEVASVNILDRRANFYGVWLNTYGGRSRLLTGPEIVRRLGRKLTWTEFGDDINQVLREKRTALFETEQEARDVVALLKAGRT